MEEAQSNPERNRLPPGLLDDALIKAVGTSGYPLQTQVASALAIGGFEVHEEWSYLDGTTLRALDIQAQLKRDEWWQHGQHLYPAVDLLIECKRSELPYVFFGGVGLAADWGAAVEVAGLRHTAISMPQPTPIASCLRLSDSPVARGATHSCTTLSHVQRKGSDLELSGSELFNGVVLPLVKAADYAVRTQFPHPTWTYFQCALQILVCVLDAPMVVAISEGTSTKLRLTPRIRLMRHEAAPVESADPYERGKGRLVGIEFVHSAQFEAFLRDEIQPTADRFADAVLEHEAVLLAGCGRYGPKLRECDEAELAGEDEMDLTQDDPT